MSSPLEQASDASALVLSGYELERRADARRPLPHSDDPVRVEAAAAAFREAHTVVEDLQRGGGPVAAPDDAHLLCVGVALDVGERFLGDAPHLPFLQDREAHPTIGEQADLEAAALGHP